MAAFGLALLGLVLLASLATGLPAHALLLAATVLGGLAGVLTGSISVHELGALPTRLVGLLEHDLLQAVPLFALTGALLEHLGLAGLFFRACSQWAGGTRWQGAADRAAALWTAAALAPLTGSVGASVATLARSVAPGLMRRGVQGSERSALVAVASTLGVLVPPSLVLLLLADAMMRAHTEALRHGAVVERVVNTQDVLRGALLPAALLLLGWLAVAAMTGWRRGSAPHGGVDSASSPTDSSGGTSGNAVAITPVSHSADAAVASPAGSADAAPTRAAKLALLATVLGLGGLLAGVASGRFYAVEAAATGALALAIGAALAGQLPAARIRRILDDALVLSGSLFALFAAATSFTLVLRLLGSDALVEGFITQLPGGPGLRLAVALVMMGACTLVLDAFEMIFVVVPILMPAVLTQSPDATWVTVLVLLVLQLGFLLPPLGYALVLTLGRLQDGPSSTPAMGALVRRLAPYLAVSLLLIALVAARPGLVHAFDDAPATAPALDKDAVQDLMRAAPSAREPQDKADDPLRGFDLPASGTPPPPASR